MLSRLLVRMYADARPGRSPRGHHLALGRRPIPRPARVPRPGSDRESRSPGERAPGSSSTWAPVGRSSPSPTSATCASTSASSTPWSGSTTPCPTEWSQAFDVRPEDIDRNQHVTFSSYIRWVETALRETGAPADPSSSLEINYLAELFLGEVSAFGGNEPIPALSGWPGAQAPTDDTSRPSCESKTALSRQRPSSPSETDRSQSSRMYFQTLGSTGTPSRMFSARVCRTRWPG